MSSSTNTTTGPSTSTQTITLLSDPLLAPFLHPTFSPIAYLNATLPPLLPPTSTTSHLPTPNPLTAQEKLQQQLNEAPPNPSAVPLSQLHPKTTSLLSTLDVQTYRLLALLQSLTDEILRVAPRLGYEVEVLKGGVLNLAGELSSEAEGVLGEGVRRFAEAEESAGEEDPTAVAGGDHTAEPATLRNSTKPAILTKLETLSKIRSRLEEVISIFGEAMSWPLPSSLTNSDDNHNLPLSKPPVTASTTASSSSSSSSSSKTLNPDSEITYLLASGPASHAEALSRIKHYQDLASVFKGTIEYDPRVKVIDELRVKAEDAVREANSVGSISSGGRVGRGVADDRDRDRDRDRKVGRVAEESGTVGAGEDMTGGNIGGYYGLINQLQRMRGMG